MRKIIKIGRFIRKMLVKGFIGMNFVLFLLSASALDSDNWMAPAAICIITFANLVMFAIANGAFGGGYDER